MAVDPRPYVHNCLEPYLIIFLDTQYIVLEATSSDKASAHYPRATTDFLDSKSVDYVKKQDNLTEAPKCRPNGCCYRPKKNSSYTKEHHKYSGLR